MRFFSKFSEDKYDEIRTEIYDIIICEKIRDLKDLERVVSAIENKLDLKSLFNSNFGTSKKEQLSPDQLDIYSRVMADTKREDIYSSIVKIAEFLSCKTGKLSDAEKLCMYSWLNEVRYQAHYRQSKSWESIFNRRPFLLNFEGSKLDTYCGGNNNLITLDGVSFIRHLKNTGTQTLNFVISKCEDIYMKTENISDTNKKINCSYTINLKSGTKINLFSVNINKEHGRYVEDKELYSKLLNIVCLLNMALEYKKKTNNPAISSLRKEYMVNAIGLMCERYEPNDFGYDKYIECVNELIIPSESERKDVLVEMLDTLIEFKEEGYFFTGNDKFNLIKTLDENANTFYFNVNIENKYMQELAIASLMSIIWKNVMEDEAYMSIPKHVIAFGVNEYKEAELCEIYSMLERRARARHVSMVCAISWQNYELQKIIQCNNSFIHI